MNQDQSEIHDKKRLKVTVNEHRTLLGRNKSKRLSQMAGRSGRGIPDSPSPCKKNSLHGTSDELAIQLANAREKIDCKINELMNRLPEGKKNKLFRLRYGTVDGIRRVTISKAFQRLGIDANDVKLGMLAGMNYFGQIEKESVES